MNHRLPSELPSFVPSSDRGRARAVFKRRAMAAAVAAIWLTPGALGLLAHRPAWALPTGAEVTAGQASIQQPNTRTLQVTQGSSKAVLDWQRFGIARDETVQFIQPSARSVVLNRVVGSDPSSIFGRLNANGQVFLVNPNGVLFGAGASVDVGSIVASTLGISNTDFLAGRYTFTGGGAGGSVVNQGTIRAADGGYVALLGNQVSNSGMIAANGGSVALGAGERITLDFNGDGRLSLSVDAAAARAQVSNAGLIEAAGGAVTLSARARNALLDTVLNVEGTIRATSLAERNGSIYLDGGESGVARVSGTLDVSGAQAGARGGRIAVNGGTAGTVNVTGTLDASASAAGQTGGAVSVLGQNVDLSATARVNVSGAAGGGTVSVQARDLSTSGRINADGTAGPGGAITVAGGWAGIGGDMRADGTTNGGRIDVHADGYSLAATLSATGGSGAGGAINVNVAGQSWENVYAKMDASGASGGAIRHIAGEQITTSGTYLARGKQGAGGKVEITAWATKLLSATVDASGVTAGGTIHVGGEFQGGKGPDLGGIPNAQRLVVSRGSTLTADATAAGGAGGQVVLWSDRESAVYGDISARPGMAGAGGLIEISSADKLTYGGTASAGSGGTVLFDPKNIVIGSAGDPQLALAIGFGYEGGLLNVEPVRNNDQFGQSVALSGTQLAVGAPGHDGRTGTATNTGAVYLINNPFTAPALNGVIGRGYTGPGNLNTSAFPTPLRNDDNFGRSLALSGTQLVVGAQNHAGQSGSSATAFTGAVYLINNPFTAPALNGVIGDGYTGSGNLNTAAFPTPVRKGDLFGGSVALSGTQLVVGAQNHAGQSGSADFTGAVYLINNPFTAPALNGVIGNGYIGAGNLDTAAFPTPVRINDTFGFSVALSGTQLVVGAIGHDGQSGSADFTGAVYLINNPFTAPALNGVIGNGYTGAGNLNTADFPTAVRSSEAFGSSVALSGTQLVVGAQSHAGQSGTATATGAVYLINNPFTAPALNGVIGNGYTGAGNLNTAAFPTPVRIGDDFGSSVALSGGQLVVGANFHDGQSNSASDTGAVYLINNPFTAPALNGVIGSGYTGAGNLDTAFPSVFNNDQFGNSVALSGTQLAVGATGHDGRTGSTTNTGAVYLFNNPFTAPALSGVIGNGYTGAGNLNTAAFPTQVRDNDLFGASVGLSGTQLAVGAPGHDGRTNTATNTGAVYLINNPFTAPALNGVIGNGYTGAGSLDTAAFVRSGDRFGSSLALSGTQLAVGASNHAGQSGTANFTGAVYLINNPFTAPALNGVIGNGYTGTGNLDTAAFPTPVRNSDTFGFSVALSGTQLVVGAIGHDGQSGSADFTGAVYLINNPFTTPALNGVIGNGYAGAGNLNTAAFPTAVRSGEAFGSSVALSGTQLVVGAQSHAGQSGSATATGAVYLINNPFTAPALNGVIGNGYTGAGNLDTAAFPTAVRPNDDFGTSVALSGGQLVVGANFHDGQSGAASNIGVVYAINISDAAASATFATNPAANSTITPSAITAITNTGSNVVLQANNDIVLNPASDIVTVPNPGANGGAITLQAGRSVLLQSNITSANGNVTIVANEAAANGVVNAQRDPGIASLTTAGIDAGSGSISLTLGDGAGLTNNSSGNVQVGALTTTGAVSLINSGSGGAITQTGAITAGTLTVATNNGEVSLTNLGNVFGSVSASGDTVSLTAPALAIGDLGITARAITLTTDVLTTPSLDPRGIITVRSNGLLNLNGLTGDGLFGTIGSPVKVQFLAPLATTGDTVAVTPTAGSIVYLAGPDQPAPRYAGVRPLCYNFSTGNCLSALEIRLRLDSPAAQAALTATYDNETLKRLLDEVLSSGYAKENVRGELVNGLVLEAGVAPPAVDDIILDGIKVPK